MLDFDRELVLSLWTSKGTISYWNQFITNKGADGFKKVLRDYIEYFNDSLELKKFLKEIGDEKECTPCQIRKARNFPLLYKTLAKDVATWYILHKFEDIEYLPDEEEIYEILFIK